MIAVAELAVLAALVLVRDPQYMGWSIGFWVPAGIASVGIAHFGTGSWRSAVLVPVIAYPVALLATRSRPGQMFRIMENQQSCDAAIQEAARRSGWRLAAALAILAVAAAALLDITHAM